MFFYSYNSYFCLEPSTGQASRGRNTSWPHSQGTAVMLAGKNVQVDSCDIYSTGDVVSTLYNGMPGGSYFHIVNNRFWNGGTTHWGIEWKQCIYESNVATGISTYNISIDRVPFFLSSFFLSFAPSFVDSFSLHAHSFTTIPVFSFFFLFSISPPPSSSSFS